MKRIISAFVIIFGLSMVLHSGIGMAMGEKPKAHSDVKTITKEELSQKLKNGDPVQVVNVLNPEYYKLGIIKGSLKIPVEELDKRMNELDKNIEVVTYCANYKCGASRNAARILVAHGFNVRAYEGGIEEWKKSGLPVE